VTLKAGDVFFIPADDQRQGTSVAAPRLARNIVVEKEPLCLVDEVTAARPTPHANQPQSAYKA